jgi:hypothetical protein
MSIDLVVFTTAAAHHLAKRRLTRRSSYIRVEFATQTTYATLQRGFLKQFIYAEVASGWTKKD